MRASVQTGLVAVALLAMAGCKAKIDSTVTVNGVALNPTSCRSGAVYGFRGVEITGANTSRIRLAASVTGQAFAYYMMPGNLVPIQLGICGPFSVTDESSVINGVRNVEGNATLGCQTTGLALAGSVTFHNCH